MLNVHASSKSPPHIVAQQVGLCGLSHLVLELPPASRPALCMPEVIHVSSVAVTDAPGSHPRQPLPAGRHAALAQTSARPECVLLRVQLCWVEYNPC